MSRAGDCYDNAFMESCFGTIKTELQMTAYETYRDALKELTEFIDYYNTSRLHSSLGTSRQADLNPPSPDPKNRTAGCGPECPVV